MEIPRIPESCKRKKGLFQENGCCHMEKGTRAIGKLSTTPVLLHHIQRISGSPSLSQIAVGNFAYSKTLDEIFWRIE